MSEQPPFVEGQTPSDEQERLIAIFDDMERNQIKFLDEASKRIIELCTGLLAVLFAVVAFGDKFPPPYLKANVTTKAVGLLTLALYVLAMLLGLVAVLPREYKRYEQNITGMRSELQRLIHYKMRWLRGAGLLFVLGCVSLALLVALIVLSA